MSIPQLFRCPISLDLFADPVTLSTGQTYDRASIERWLAQGNFTCPVTMQRLHDTSLVPNHTLRHLIDQWLLAGTAVAAARAHSNGIQLSLTALKLKLQSRDTSLDAKLETLKMIRVLSLESDVGQACLIEQGFFPLLLQLLLQAPLVDDSEVVQVALDCVLGLSPSSHLELLNTMKEEPNLGSFVSLLVHGNVKIKTSLCSLLETMASSPVTQQVCLALGRSRTSLRALVSLVSNTDSRASDAAVRALHGLCSLEANRSNAVKEGAMEVLICFLCKSVRRNASRALATIEALAGLEAGKRALIKNPNAVQVLVRKVFQVSSEIDGSEHAIGVLLVLCCDSPRVRAVAVHAGVLKQLLLLLQSQCGGKAKSKARALLKLLRCMWNEDPGVRNFHNAI